MLIIMTILKSTTTDDSYCIYYTPDDISQTIGNENNQLSMFSLNCRSIYANWDSLNQLIYNMTTEHCRFDFIGLTEVFKFNDYFNYSIQGYHAVEYNTRDSDDGHGGVDIYVNSDMSYCRRDDLSIFIPHVIETLFIEVKLNQTKSIILGVIYRPNSQPRADMDIFTTTLADITTKINSENKESYIMGDFNIDLLKFQSHEKTKYFIESMLTTGYLPVITKPTIVTDHSATLLDHIYSNSKALNYTSGIVISDVADHFGTFYVSRKKTHITVSNYKYIRQMKAGNFIHFKQILAATDFSPVLACDCPNEVYNKFICEYENAFNIALPTKRIKLLRKYIKREPWMTQGLLNSSLNKSKLLRTKI